MSDINHTPDMEEENDGILYLTDEEGNDHPFELLDIVIYQDEDYAVFFPAEGEDDDEDAGEVVILKVIPQDDESAEFISIDDESILDEVFAIFMEHLRQEFEEGDDCGCDDDDCGCHHHHD